MGGGRAVGGHTLTNRHSFIAGVSSSQFARPSIAWAGVVLFHQGERTSRRDPMILAKTRKLLAGAAAAAVIIALGSAYAQQGPRGKTSYIFPVDMEPFSTLFARLSAQKPDVTREQ